MRFPNMEALALGKENSAGIENRNRTFSTVEGHLELLMLLLFLRVAKATQGTRREQKTEHTAQS